MKKKYKKTFKKTFLISITIILFLAVVIIIFISPITKYLIEKYDEKYFGRQITMDWAYVNPFTGYVNFSNLKIYEEKSNELFFSANSLSANFEIRKVLFKTYELSEITLDHPRGMIIQKKNILNFTDIINRFSSKQKNTPRKPPVHFNILGIKIIDGEFFYLDKLAPVKYYIKNVNIESEGKQWNSDTIATTVSFQSGIGTGDVKGTFSTNFKDKTYRFAVHVNKFDLKVLEQYLKELINYGTFSANMDADLKATGSFLDKEDVTVKGAIAINQFHFGKTPEEDYGSFEKLVVAIDELSPKKHIYLIDSATIRLPYFKFERYENNMDNVQMMFGKHGANLTAANKNPESFNLLIEIAKYVKVLAKNFFKSDYKINRLAVYAGDFKYNDYTLNEKFSVDANPIFALADSINKNNHWVKASFITGLKPYGNAVVSLRINPNDSSDFDVNYQIQKVPAPLFNPYLIQYTSFPLDRGIVELKGSCIVRKNIINSNNHFIIIDPRLNNRVKNKDNKWIPMKIAMFFIREQGNVIDYEVPISGNLKDPKFHLKDVIFDALTNIFVKPATTPYRVEVKNTESEIEKYLSLKWEMRSSVLKNNQEKFVGQMATFLEGNPTVSIEVTPKLYTEREEEYIVFFEAKKKYFLFSSKTTASNFSETDSIKVDMMSIKDILFSLYLNKQVSDPMIFTIQERCSRFVGKEIVDKKLLQLNIARKDTFLSLFKNKGVESRVKINSPQNEIPFNGFSYYKIDYKGEYPEPLIKAYVKMNDFNSKPPRKKYKNERRKDKSKL